MFRSIMTGSQDEAAVQVLCCGALKSSQRRVTTSPSQLPDAAASLALRAAMQHADDAQVVMSVQGCS